MPLTLVHKEHLTDNIWAFQFSSSEPLSYTPGQYVQVELPHDNPDSEGARRWFTNSAAPFQGILQITTRVTNTTFKQALSSLPIGGELQLIAQPDGDFVWQDSDRPLVFVAGGIGVTPFYSIVKQRVHDRLPLNATLIYGGRNEDLPFRAEFDDWAATNAGFQVEYAIGAPLTAATLSALAPNLNASLVYLSGPEPMVEALGDDLKQHGLPAEQLKQDFFPNYTETNYSPLTVHRPLARLQTSRSPVGRSDSVRPRAACRAA